MIVALFANPALALDCTSRHLETCEAVNDLMAMVNAESGAAVIVDAGGPARFRTPTLYNQLNAVRLAATAGGCRTDNAFDGYTGGVFRYSSGSFVAGSAAEDGGTWRDVAGDVDYADGTFVATDDGTVGIGDTFSTLNSSSQIVADRDGDGFLAGTWIRTTGSRGVFVSLHGECDGPTPAWDAFEGWYDGDIPFNPPTVTNLALVGTASQSSNYSGTIGLAPAAIDGNTNGVWGNLSVTHTLNGTNEWWQVDLGGIYFIEDVVLWNRTDCCGGRLHDFNVYVSDVPFASTNPVTTAADPNVATQFQVSPPAPSSSFVFDRTGRYVRVQLAYLDSQDYLQLAEVQVFGY